MTIISEQKQKQKQLKASLRKRIRSQRNALTSSDQKSAALKLARQVIRSPDFLKCQRIAFYIANDGEIDTGPILKKAWQMGKSCYLPVLTPFSKKLYFVKYGPDTKLIANRFNIPEPRLIPRLCRPAWSLDAILAPLVAFDQAGNRLGMGGGYYDRSLAFKTLDINRKPLLIGLAYQFQQQKKLPSERWDIRLNKAFTEQAVYDFSKNNP